MNNSKIVGEHQLKDWCFFVRLFLGAAYLWFSRRVLLLPDNYQEAVFFLYETQS
jgi:hypothetical protein